VFPLSSLLRLSACVEEPVMDRPATIPAAAPAWSRPSVPCLSARALSTPEPLVRAFARRVQQEGALDLTQGDYKNADFAPHPEVVRAAQRITRNTVHSYGSAVGRMDVRSEIDLRIEGWLRALPDTLSRELRHAWAPPRELDKDALTLRAIEQMITLEQRRGSRGA